MSFDTPQSRTLALGAGRPTVEVLEAGEGAPLLFLHGAGGIRLWEGALPLLAHRFRVYAPLLPGFGDRCDRHGGNATDTEPMGEAATNHEFVQRQTQPAGGAAGGIS